MLEKGSYGYIDRQKKRRIFMILTIMAVAFFIYGLGLLLNKMSRANIFTVLSVLCVLPWARQLVALIVLFPFHSVTGERYERIKGIWDRLDIADGTLYTDIVITSPDKVMNLDFVAVGGGKVVALVGRGGQDIGYIREYLAGGVRNWGDLQVKVSDREDLFTEELERMKDREAERQETESVKAYLISLMV